MIAAPDFNVVGPLLRLLVLLVLFWFLANGSGCEREFMGRPGDGQSDRSLFLPDSVAFGGEHLQSFLTGLCPLWRGDHERKRQLPGDHQFERFANIGRIKLSSLTSSLMARDFQTYLKLFRVFRPQSTIALPEPQIEAAAKTEINNTLEKQASEACGLPIGERVRVTFRGPANPELFGIVELHNPPLLLEDDSMVKELEFRIGESVFRLDDVESWCRL